MELTAMVLNRGCSRINLTARGLRRDELKLIPKRSVSIDNKKRNKLISLLFIFLLAIIVIPFVALPAFAATLLSDDFEAYSSFPSGSSTNASGNGTWSTPLQAPTLHS
ncbi:hypothetical protein [Paenibacillus agricola]|uniref:Uncharacterized protein n=1 Tax=Paenibacillus agricola TaxID=2716264 RepID=A0ABX0J1L6_9BACL|nr:hypothetical protein [Paenibacillus agricola]NHN30017.1 hypothetical protein [Paenibacillus agricola]